MLKQSVDEGFGVEHCIDREGGGDKYPSESGQLRMGYVGIKLPGETFIARFGEGVAFGLQHFEDGMELFTVGWILDVVTIGSHHR